MHRKDCNKTSTKPRVGKKQDKSVYQNFSAVWMALWILRRCRSFYSENKSLCETPRSWSDLTEDDFYSNDEIWTIKVLVSQQDYRLFWFDWSIDQWNGLIDQHTKDYEASPNWFTIGCFRFPNRPGRKDWGWNGNRNRPNLERTLKGEGKGDPKSKKVDTILSFLFRNKAKVICFLTGNFEKA